MAGQNASSYLEFYKVAVLSTGVRDGFFSEQAAELATEEDIVEYSSNLSRFYGEYPGGIKGRAPTIAMKLLAESLKTRLGGTHDAETSR